MKYIILSFIVFQAFVLALSEGAPWWLRLLPLEIVTCLIVFTGLLAILGSVFTAIRDSVK